MPRAIFAGSTSASRRRLSIRRWYSAKPRRARKRRAPAFVLRRFRHQLRCSGFPRPRLQRVVQRAAEAGTAVRGSDQHADSDASRPCGDVRFFYVPVTRDVVLMDSHPRRVQSFRQAARFRVGDLVSSDGPRREAGRSHARDARAVARHLHRPQDDRRFMAPDDKHRPRVRRSSGSSFVDGGCDARLPVGVSCLLLLASCATAPGEPTRCRRGRDCRGPAALRRDDGKPHPALRLGDDSWQVIPKLRGSPLAAPPLLDKLGPR